MKKLSQPIIVIKNVHKSFVVGSRELKILRNVDFSVNDGDFLVIFGPSGCGKSTLLHTILGLEKPSQGSVIFYDEDIYSDNSTEDSRAVFRKQMTGMVFQQSNWIKALDVKENVAFPLLLLGIGKSDALVKAKKILDFVGMGDWSDNMANELSAGQQQRVSLARALVHNPEVIITDEPTGNLDYQSGQKVMKLLYDLNQNFKKTIIMVTHDLEYLKFANRYVQLFDGEVVGIYGKKDLKKITDNIKYKRGVGKKEVAKKTKKNAKS